MLVALAACSRVDVKAMFEAYQWEKRVLLVFAPERNSPELKQQWDMILREQPLLKERDYVVWVLVANQNVTVDGEAKPHLFTRPFYEYFNVKEDEFTVIILGLDGQAKLRAETPVMADTITGIVDVMPSRKHEIRRGSTAN